MKKSMLAILAYAALVSGCQNEFPASPSSETDEQGSVGSVEAVVQFEARSGSSDEAIVPVITQAASQPHVAKLTLSQSDRTRVSGTLLFETMEGFETWRSSDMQPFFDQFGEEFSVTSLRVRLPRELARASDNGLASIADDINIAYRNTGNDADGDADIDAVTVICGDGADCTPSN